MRVTSVSKASVRKLTAIQKLAWLPPMSVNVSESYALGNYSEADITSRIPASDWNRKVNLARAWARICTHLPETSNLNQTYDILEFSTNHGAMLELWRGLGHRVRGTDVDFGQKARRNQASLALRDGSHFLQEHRNKRDEDRPGWRYQPVIESLGLEVDLFKPGRLSFPYENKSFDFVCCYQAIERYAQPEDWDDILAEFCRIARRGVVIGFTAPTKQQVAHKRMKVLRHAWEELRCFNKHGFTTSFFEVGETGVGVFPTTVRLSADG